MAVSRLSILRFLEMAISIVCLGLLYHNGLTGDVVIDILTAGTIFGFVIILVGGFSGYMLSSPITRKVDIFYCLVGCALFVAVGALNIKHYENTWKGEKRDYGLAIASLSIINGALFLIDALLVWRGDF